MENPIKELCSQLEERGLKGRVVAARRLPDLKDEIEGRQAQGLFDEGFPRKDRIGCYATDFRQGRIRTERGDELWTDAR